MRNAPQQRLQELMAKVPTVQESILRNQVDRALRPNGLVQDLRTRVDNAANARKDLLTAAKMKNDADLDELVANAPLIARPWLQDSATRDVNAEMEAGRLRNLEAANAARDKAGEVRQTKADLIAAQKTPSYQAAQAERKR